MVPFLVVLCFNSLIIYNFKQIKLNALGYGHTKSNSCVSVFSGGSYTSNFIGGAHSRSNSLKNRNRKRTKRNALNEPQNSTSFNDYKGVNGNKEQENIYFLNNSSRSPSPLMLTRSNTPIVGGGQQPTNLVSALNLDNTSNNKTNSNKLRTSSPSPHLISSNDSKSIASNSSGNCVETAQNNPAKYSPSKLFDSSYLMPPTQSSVRHQQQQQRLLEQQMNYKSASPSIGTTNSSANLSVAGSSNLTATTNLYQTNHISFSLTNNNSISNNNNNNLLTHEKSETSPDFNMVETDLDTTQNSNKISITVNPIEPKSLLTASNTPTKSSYRRRAFKLKLNRETDIMLIVLSFSILLSQLPCTIAYYLIYHCNILNKMRDDVTSVYLTARIPIILYIIRLLEMAYFSLNFFFYITLSPSLRKEIKTYSSREALASFWQKTFVNSKLVRFVCGEPKQLKNETKKQANINISKNTSNNLDQRKKIDTNSMNNSILDADNVYSKSPSKYDNITVPVNNNCTNFFLGSSENINGTNIANNNSNNNNRLNSNSSGEYYEFIQKLRSISPLRKPNFLSNESSRVNTPKIKITDAELSEEKHEKNNSKKSFRLFPKKNRNKKETKNGTFRNQDPKIQIIIDNVNDEENIVIDHNISYSDPI